MFAAVRKYATARTIPYVTKNNWKLPAEGLAAGQPQATGTANDQSWGTAPTAEYSKVNVPRGWRKLRTLPQWKRQMFALKEKFPDGWDPKRKLSRDEMQQLRELKAAQPQLSLNELGTAFKISPEAVRRIVKSRWQPKERETVKLKERWTRRGLRLDSWTAKRAEGGSQARAARNGAARNAPGKQTNGTGGSTKKRQTRKLHDPGQDIF